MNSLICSAENLCDVVRTSEAEHKKRRDAIKSRQDIAMGAMAEEMDRAPSPENLAFGVFSIFVPSMVTSSPAGHFASSGGYKESVAAAGLANGTTQMARAQKMHRSLEPCAWDFFFQPYCAGIVETGSANMSDLTAEERKVAMARLHPGVERDVGGEVDDEPGPRGHATPSPQLPPQWARFKHLKPNEAGWDTRMGSRDRARFTYHVMTEDRATLQQRAEENPDDWIPDACAICSTVDSWPGLKEQFAGEENTYCRYYVVYVPDGRIPGQDPKPNQPGVIYTIGGETLGQGDGSKLSGLEIRKPYYFTGHPDGLHIFEGNYTTGADSHFLSLLAANEDSLARMEAVSASLHDRIDDHKTVYAYDSTSQEAAETLAKAPNGAWVSVPGLQDGSGAIQSIENSAPTPVEFTTYDRVRYNAGLALGIDSSGLGVADPNATATAVGVAANATRTKVEYLLGRWNRFVAEAFERMAFEAGHNSSIVVRLDEGARASVLRAQLKPLMQSGALRADDVEAIVEDQKMRPMLFSGGDFAPDGQGLDWHSLQLTVVPHSTDGAFGDAQVARQMQWNQALAFFGDVMVRQPHVRWVDRIRETGRSMGMTDADMAVDIDKAMEVAQIQLAQGSPQATTSSTANQYEDSGPALATGGGGQAPVGMEA